MLTINQGETAEWAATYYTNQATGAVADLTGCSAELVFKDSPTATTNLLRLTTGEGITIANGVITATIAASATRAITWRRAVALLALTWPGGRVEHLAREDVVVEPWEPVP